MVKRLCEDSKKAVYASQERITLLPVQSVLFVSFGTKSINKKV